MDHNLKKSLINALINAAATDQPVTIERENNSVAVVLSVEDYQKFQAEHEEKLKLMKRELDGLLTLVRSYTGHQTLAEVEARLAALRQEIEQEK